MGQILVGLTALFLSVNVYATDFTLVQADLQPALKESLKKAMSGILGGHRCGGLWDTQESTRGVLRGAHTVMANPGTVISQAADGQPLIRFDLKLDNQKQETSQLLIRATNDLKVIESAEFSSQSTNPRTGKVSTVRYSCKQKGWF